MYRLHPEQVLRPAPVTELRSLHPNHVWQIDASLCVLYYLRAGTAKGNGLQVLDADKFYKNKPSALERVENERVWRYVVTDHYSGAVFVHYVLGAESGLNLAESLIAAMQQRDGDVLHGVPFILMMDMGSANTAGGTKNLLRRLQIEQIAHAPGNARATGQVEKAQDIWERRFEAALKFQPVHSLAELNGLARMFARHLNSQDVHSRHGRTRAAVWQEIAEDKLRLAPAPDVCRSLLTHEPETRKVTPAMTVQYGGREYDVRGIPHVAVGEKLLVSINVYAAQAESICVIDTDAEGKEVLHVAPVVERNEAGFRLDANVIGQDYKRQAETQIDANRKLLARLATDTKTDEAAALARKAKVAPFGGRIDPLKQARETVLPTPMPKRGAQLVPAAEMAAVPARVLNHFEAAKELLNRGVRMDKSVHNLIRQQHPDGVPECELDALAQRLKTRGTLQVVAGGAR